MKRVHGILILILAIFTLFAACKDPAGGGGGDDYTVTFDKNHTDASGFTEANPQTIKVTSPATTVGTLPTEPTRKDYTFQNWNTAANGSGSAFTESTAVTENITVYAQWKLVGTKYTIAFDTDGDVTGDAVSASPTSAEAGDTITINYTLAGGYLNNRLVFSGVEAAITEVNEAGTGTRTYTVDAEDADQDGKITIDAIFTHTNKEIDTIAFEHNTVQKTYGDAVFTVTASAGQGSGAVTYSSSHPDIATVNTTTGEVTILKAGSTTIKATKAADETYEEAIAEYTLTISKAAGATLTGPLTTVQITTDTIEVTAVTAPGNGQTVEYAIVTTNNEPESNWQDETTFTELYEGTTYYIFARAAGNDNYAAGAAISGSFSTTAPPATAVTSWNFLTTEPPIEPSPYVNTAHLPGKVRFETTRPGNATITWASGQGLTVVYDTNYHSKLLIIPFVLPSGKSLNDYSSISFNFIKETAADTGSGKTTYANVLKSGQTTFSDNSGGNNNVIFNSGQTFVASPAATELTLTILKTNDLSHLTGEIEIGFYFNVNPITMRITSITLNE